MTATPRSIQVLTGFLLFQLLLVVSQTWAFFDYDFISMKKLQEPRVLADEAVIQSNRSVCAAQAVVMLPLNLLAIVGIWQHRFYGLVCAWMLLGTSLYWPVMFVASRYTYESAGIRHVALNGADFSVCLGVFLFACWGSWTLCQPPFIADVFYHRFPSNEVHRRDAKKD